MTIASHDQRTDVLSLFVLGGIGAPLANDRVWGAAQRWKPVTESAVAEA